MSAVLLGRITQRGDNLTISAELVDVRYNKLLWGEQRASENEKLYITMMYHRAVTHDLEKAIEGARSGSILTRVTGDRITRSPIFIWKLESLRKQPRTDARPCALTPRLLLPIQTTQAR